MTTSSSDRRAAARSALLILRADLADALGVRDANIIAWIERGLLPDSTERSVGMLAWKVADFRQWITDHREYWSAVKLSAENSCRRARRPTPNFAAVERNLGLNAQPTPAPAPVQSAMITSAKGLDRDLTMPAWLTITHAPDGGVVFSFRFHPDQTVSTTH